MKITKSYLRKLILERVQDSLTLEIELADTGSQPVEIPWNTIMDALEKDSSVDRLFVVIEEFIENEYGFDEYFKLTDKSDAEVRKMHDEYQAGGILSDEESYERGFYEGKVTKSRLRKLVREEKQKLLEAPRDRIKVEAVLMADLNDIASAIDEISGGLYGMSGPGTVNGDDGDEMARDLELQVERLNDFYGQMVNHFESMDPENQDENEGRPNRTPHDPYGRRKI